VLRYRTSKRDWTPKLSGQGFADAAKAAGASGILFSSVGSAERGGIPIHFDSSSQVEEYIRAIGLPLHNYVRPFLQLQRCKLIQKSRKASPAAQSWIRNCSKSVRKKITCEMVAEVSERPAEFLHSEKKEAVWIHGP